MCDSVTATVLSTSTSSSLQSCWIVYTNNQGTERLVVTRRNNGPIDGSGLPCTTGGGGVAMSSGGGIPTGKSGHPGIHPTGTAAVDLMTSGMQSLNLTNAATTVGATATTTTTSAEAALDYKSLNSILDDNLRPLKPVPGIARSEQIHNEHKQLVQEYWEIQTQIVTNQAHRDALQMNIPAEELRLKKEYLKKFEEKEALLKFKANLQKQLDERKRHAACATQNSLAGVPTAHLQHNHHQQSAPPPSSSSSSSATTSPSLQRQDSTAEAGWVIISPEDGANNPS